MEEELQDCLHLKKKNLHHQKAKEIFSLNDIATVNIYMLIKTNIKKLSRLNPILPRGM